MAAMIKFYIPLQSPGLWKYQLLTVRGPFDVQRTTQTVILDPPVDLQAGDLIAIASLTTCGGPVRGDSGTAIVVPGNTFSTLIYGPLPPTFTTPGVLLQATDGGTLPPPRSQVEQVLAPLAPGEFDGAFGSHFVVELWARNDTDQPAKVFRLTCGNNPRVCASLEVPTTPIPPRTTTRLLPLDNGFGSFKIGEFLWVEKAAAPKVFFSLRVRDTSRSGSSAGVEIPTPRESASPWRMRQQLLNVPVEAGLRHTLRIYTSDYVRDPTIVISERMKIYDMETDALLVDDAIGFNGFEGEGPDAYTVEPFPNSRASFLDKYTGALQGHTRVRLEIESNFYSFWAFLTVANNVTQEITAIAP